MSADIGGAIAALEPAQGEMAPRNSLKMTHEDDIDRSSTDGTDNRDRAGRHLIRNHEAEPRYDPARLGDTHRLDPLQ